MATTNKIFCRLSFGFAISCLIFLITSFASDQWVVSTQTEVAGFKNLGLWSACFAKFRPPAWVLNKYYDGCWWVFDREMDDLRFFLIPSWFVTTQVLVTLSLVFQLIAIIMMIVNAINCFPHSRFKDQISLGLSITAAVLHGLTAILLTIAVILFGARADNERTWLEKPDQNYLSWSFGMCVLAAFLAVLAFMTTSLESYRLWLKRKNNEDPDKPFTIPLSATNMKKYPPSASLISHPPVYTSRFSNQGSRSDILPGRAAAELHTNNSHNVDETRQRGRTNGYIPQHERHQEKRLFDSEKYVDNVDSTYTQTASIAPSSQTNSASTKTSVESTDYEDSKKIIQPVLPEYIPKTKPDSVKKDLDSSFDESYDSDDKLNEDDDHSRSRKKNSSGKSKKTAKNLSNSKKDKDNKNKKHSGKKNKKKENDTSDDEHSRSRSHSRKSTSRSKRKSSHSRERSSSRHRSHSRDLNSVYSDSCSDSDSPSVVNTSRRRQKKDEESSKKSRSRNRSSEKSIKNDKHGRSISSTVSSKKKRKGSYSDNISDSEYSSKQQSKRRGDKSRSLADKRSKSLDFSDSESLSSKHSKRGGRKSKTSYSSYYEY